MDTQLPYFSWVIACMSYPLFMFYHVMVVKWLNTLYYERVWVMVVRTSTCTVALWLHVVGCVGGVGGGGVMLSMVFLLTVEVGLCWCLKKSDREFLFDRTKIKKEDDDTKKRITEVWWGLLCSSILIKFVANVISSCAKVRSPFDTNYASSPWLTAIA